MSRDEIQSHLTEHLARYRVWSHGELAERVERYRKANDCLDHIEGTASDGTEYQIELQAVLG